MRPSPAFNPDFTLRVCPESRRRAIVRFCLSSIGVALLPAFTDVLIFMFVPFLHEYRRGFETRFNSGLDFHFFPFLEEYRRGLEARLHSGFDFHIRSFLK